MVDKIKAIIYDFDDVLISVAKRYFQLLNETAIKLRSRTFTFEEFSHVYGLPEDSIVSKLFPGISPDRVIQTYRDSPVQYQLITGAREVLSYTLAKYPVNGILTSRRRTRLIRRAIENNIDLQQFNFVFTHEDMTHSKPDPRAFNSVHKELTMYSLSPDRAVYIGDSLLDFQAANGAGLQFIGVLTGITEKHKFVKYGVPPNRILQSVAELPVLLQSDLNG